MALTSFATTTQPTKKVDTKPKVVKDRADTSPKGRVSQMYNRNLEILAKTMRDRAEQELANVEGRGVLRSGEADTMATRRAEDEATQKRYLKEDRDYQLAQIARENAAISAARAAASGGGGGGGGGGVSSSPTTNDLYSYLLSLGLAPAPPAPKPVGQRLEYLPTAPRPGTIRTTRYRL